MEDRERQPWFETVQRALEALPRYEQPRFTMYAPGVGFDELVTNLSAQADLGPQAFADEVGRLSGAANGDALRSAVAIVLEHHPKLQ